MNSSSLKEKKEILLSYMKANVGPILVDFIHGEDIDNAYTIEADTSLKDLNGTYDNDKLIPPNWYTKMTNRKILVIDRIDTISKKSQLKFHELLKYRKMGTFKLNDDCIILVTTESTDKSKINPEILNLLVWI